MPIAPGIPICHPPMKATPCRANPPDRNSLPPVRAGIATSTPRTDTSNSTAMLRVGGEIEPRRRANTAPSMAATLLAPALTKAPNICATITFTIRDSN